MTGDEPTVDGEPELAVGADAFVDAGAGLNVAVIGAGAIGATTAYDLARRGAEVTLYDRGSVASGSTGRAAGVCYDAFAGELDAEIGREAIERLRRFSGDDTFPFVECPYVWLAREGDDRRAERIREDVVEMQRIGVVAAEMEPNALADRFPTLRTDDVAAAGIAGAAGYTEPARYAACLAAAANGAGATLRPETPVDVRVDPPMIVERDGGERREVDAVVVTAGAHTKALLADAGIDIAMKPYRVQALVADAAYDEPMCFDATADCYVRPHPDGLLAGDGTERVEADPDDWKRAANDGFAADLREAVVHRFPSLSPTVDREWAGLCTATPDRDPLVGEVADGVFVATGFQGHGFMRAPAIGDRLAEQVVGGDGIAAFDPTRFDGDEPFEIEAGMTIDPDG
ncbi:FAD-binding oxidoreductase [Halovivax sp.]|uniref:NAD(P)/FAD-dependent oxidoreductase n=1 Tax=Halovivax sp. TaxID=1935978 RepID=UPI0025C072FD|nr:FAD-binding oxidoreductase [Halovivax sp.]